MAINNSAVKVATGSSFLIMRSIGAVLVQLLTFAIIARFLTPTELGVVSTLFMALSFSMTIASLGLAWGNTKFIAEFIGRGEYENAAGVCYQTIRSNAISSIFLGLICYLLSDRISLFLLKNMDYSTLFKVLSLDVFLTGIHQSLNSGLFGLLKFKEISLFNMIRLIVKQALTILVLLRGYGLFGVVVAWVVSDLLNCFMFAVPIFKVFGLPSFNFDLKTLLKFSLPLYFKDILQFFFGWIDRGLLLALFTVDDLGIYMVAQRPFQNLTDVIDNIGSVLYPNYSELYSKDGGKSLEKAIMLASRYVSFAVMPLAFGLLAVARPVISLLAGSSYMNAAEMLAIFCLFWAITSIRTALTGTLLILEKTITVSILDIMSAIMTIAIGVILSTSLGVNGIAVAKGLSWFISLILYILILKRHINLKIDNEAFMKSYFSGAIMAILLIALQIFYQNVLLLPLYVLLGAVIYFIMLKVLRTIKKSDLDLLKLIIGKRYEFLVRYAEIFLLTKNE